MNNVLLMQELERKASLSNNLDGLLFRKGHAIQHIVHVLALKVLLNDKKVLSVLKDIVHADNVGVARIHQYLELVDQEIVKDRLL